MRICAAGVAPVSPAKAEEEAAANAASVAAAKKRRNRKRKVLMAGSWSMELGKYKYQK
jgi:hypothetical protein